MPELRGCVCVCMRIKFKRCGASRSSRPPLAPEHSVPAATKAPPWQAPSPCFAAHCAQCTVPVLPLTIALQQQHQHLAPSLELVDLPDDCLVQCLAQLTMSER